MDVEKREVSLPKTLEDLADVEEIGLLRLRGYNYVEIGKLKGIDPKNAKKKALEYQELLQYQAANDPDFMDRVQEHTIQFLKQYDDLSKEAWESVEIATTEGLIGARINAIKLAGEFLNQKGKLLQLMGASVDSSYIARMNRAESVNNMLSHVLKETVVDCPNCRDLVRMKLAEAFSLMGNIEEAVDAIDVESDEDTDV